MVLLATSFLTSSLRTFGSTGAGANPIRLPATHQQNAVSNYQSRKIVGAVYNHTSSLEDVQLQTAPTVIETIF